MKRARSYVCEALVVRTVPFAETSQVVHLATEEHGLVAALAKGARRPGPEHQGGLTLAAIGQAELTARRGADLEILRRFRRRDRFRGLGSDLSRYYAASYVLELLRAWMRPAQPNAALYRAATTALEGLGRGVRETLPFWLAWFEARTVAATGHRPVLTGCAACGRLEPSGSVFAPGAGGVVHRACATEGPRRGLSRDGAAALRRLYETALVELVSAPLEARGLAEIRAVHDLYVPHLLERRPRTLETIPR